MTEPLWKRLISYLVEWPVAKTSSPHNSRLEVGLRFGRYRLTTDNAIYSFDDLYDHFYKAFQKTRWTGRIGNRCLLLGLGLGSIPSMLERRFDQKLQYTAVDIDPVVISLFQKYLEPRLESPVEYHCDDAAHYIQSAGQSFDLIAMDVFTDVDIPDQCQSESFLADLSRLLAPGGWLFYNRLAATPEDRQKTKSFFEGSFKKYFPEAVFLDTRTNWILLNRPDILLPLTTN